MDTGKVSETLQLLFAAIFVFCIFFAMISDFSKLRIPNTVSIILVLSFAAYAFLGGIPSVWPHVLLAGAVFAVLFVTYAMGWLGAGDVKLLAALMLWAGPSQGGVLFVLFAIFGGLFAIMLLALRSVLPFYPALAEWPVTSKFSRWARNGLIPYGIPIGIAALCVTPSIFPLQ